MLHVCVFVRTYNLYMYTYICMSICMYTYAILEPQETNKDVVANVFLREIRYCCWQGSVRNVGYFVTHDL